MITGSWLRSDAQIRTSKVNSEPASSKRLLRTNRNSVPTKSSFELKWSLLIVIKSASSLCPWPAEAACRKIQSDGRCRPRPRREVSADPPSDPIMSNSASSVNSVTASSEGPRSIISASRDLPSALIVCAVSNWMATGPAGIGLGVVAFDVPIRHDRMRGRFAVQGQAVEIGNDLFHQVEIGRRSDDLARDRWDRARRRRGLRQPRIRAQRKM